MQTPCPCNLRQTCEPRRTVGLHLHVRMSSLDKYERKDTPTPLSAPVLNSFNDSQRPRRKGMWC